MTTHRHPSNASDALLQDLLRRRFPLLPRPKPVCRPLGNRIARVRKLAELADEDSGDAFQRAAEAHNLAALIASDCGMPTLARNLCWRQFRHFARGGPYCQAAAKLALQPLINLGRLHTREGRGAEAYNIHKALFHAIQTRTQTRIDEEEVDFGRIVQSGEPHRDVTQWVWSVLLADGLRALCRAGRWAEAQHQAELHNGIGQRLFDGRQVAIIARITENDYTEAVRLLDATETATPWENAVAACLRTICLTSAQRPTDLATVAMINSYLLLHPEPEATIFYVRLGLTIADLASKHDIQPVARRIEQIAMEPGDAYAAHEILASTTLPLEEVASNSLRTALAPAGLKTPLPPHLLHDLMQSVHASETAIARFLPKGPIATVK